MKDERENKNLDLSRSAPLTNAERQKAYRERRKSENNQRLDVYIDEAVAAKFADIVAVAGDSQKDVLTSLIEKEYKRLYAVKNSKLKQYVEGKAENNAKKWREFLTVDEFEDFMTNWKIVDLDVRKKHPKHEFYEKVDNECF